MFRKLIKNKKAQNTAEYAILISLVVAGIIAMQTYAQRGLQARVRDGVQFLMQGTNDLGNTTQYEPYYLTTNYAIITDSTQSQLLGTNQVSQDDTNSKIREAKGSKSDAYTQYGLINGI